MTDKHRRIVSIDILKVIAVIAVLNSHMEICYGDYAVLSTGGAIGDALFFFCSGYMLFRQECIRFDNYIKKKITRIYPTVFMVSILVTICFDYRLDLLSIICNGGGWFINCIMIYFVVMWFIHRYFIRHLTIIGILTGLVIIGSYYFFEFSYNGMTIYGNTYYKWIFFFVFMLQGALIGKNNSKYQYSVYALPMMIFCVIAWYLILYCDQRYETFERIKYISIIPLLGMTYFGYKFCCAEFWQKIYDRRITGQLLFIVGNLCLESYLIQSYLFTDRFNSIFPLNIPLMMLIVIAVAYIVNMLTSVLLQTLRKGDYDWRMIFLLRRQIPNER